MNSNVLLCTYLGHFAGAGCGKIECCQGGKTLREVEWPTQLPDVYFFVDTGAIRNMN